MMYCSPDPLQSLTYAKDLDMVREKYTKKGIVKNLLRREMCGAQLNLTNPFGASYPERFRMPLEQMVPRYALEAGNIFMGFTDCGRYVMSYTARPSDSFGVSWGELTFVYKLHFWLFVPYKPIRKVSSVLLFDNNGVVDNNLLIEISQWNMDDERILVTGHSSNPDGDGDPHHTQFYATITTIPPTQTANCADCKFVLDEEFEEENGNIECRTLHPCLRHGLTIHLTFDHVSPFPRFDSEVQLRFQNSVAFNTGNVLHVFSFKLLEPQPIKSNSTTTTPITPNNNTTTTTNNTTTSLSPTTNTSYIKNTNNNTNNNDITPLLQQQSNINNTDLPLPFLRCDLWFKSNYSLSTILSKGPIRDDTKFYYNNNNNNNNGTSSNNKKTNASSPSSSSSSASYFLDSTLTSEESNILSLNAQESLLAILPYMNSANQKIIMNDIKQLESLKLPNSKSHIHRRLSQSSLDSLDFASSIPSPNTNQNLTCSLAHPNDNSSSSTTFEASFSTSSPASPSSSSLRSRSNINSNSSSSSPNNNNKNNNNTPSSLNSTNKSNAQYSPHKVINNNSSPNSKKLMLPPNLDGERKFFKRRISNNSQNSSPVKQNIINNTNKMSASPDKTRIKSSFFNFTDKDDIKTDNSNEKPSDVNNITNFNVKSTNIIINNNNKNKNNNNTNNNNSISKNISLSSSISSSPPSSSSSNNSNTSNPPPPPTISSPSAYDIFEISVGTEDVLQESFRTFSSFRKRKLADKKYEFSEADISTENIVPLKSIRKIRKSSFAPVLGGLGSPRSHHGGGDSPRHLVMDNPNNTNYLNMNPRSPRSHYVLSPAMSPNSSGFAEYQPTDVLRPINSNMNVKLPAFSPNNQNIQNNNNNNNNSNSRDGEDWLDFGLNSPTGSIVGDIEKTKIQQGEMISNNNNNVNTCSQIKSRSRGSTPKRTILNTSNNNNSSEDPIGKMILKCNNNSDVNDINNGNNIINNGSNKNDSKNSNPNARPTMGVSINCIAKVLRSYVERESEEDDNVSVITDIEDDIHGNLDGNTGQPFPVALPLDVHGKAYGALNMISNAKAEKCQVPVVQVLQRTLDIELLCNEVAGIICHSANKYYCSCCDYDVSIVDVCPEKGTITAVVFVLVQAASLNIKSPGRSYDRNVHAGLGYQDPRKKYEAVFSFAWEPSQEYCRLLYLGNLLELELNAVLDPWHPTRHILSLIKICSQNTVRGIGNQERTTTLNNHLAVHDFLSVAELTDSRGMITLYKDDNETQKTDNLHSLLSATVIDYTTNSEEEED